MLCGLKHTPVSYVKGFYFTQQCFNRLSKSKSLNGSYF